MTDNAAGAVAVIGAAVRTPGAADLEEFWAVRREGRWQGSLLTAAELDEAGVPADRRARSGFVPVSAQVARYDRFDADFFGMTPRDAAMHDPQFRVLLEVAWHAFEDAGVDPATFTGRVGVFVGSGSNSYLWTNVLPALDSDGQADEMQVRLSTDKDFLATLLSYTFDLRGPSVTVQSACSTSLVAVHQGVQALLTYEADMVLAGGVRISLPPDAGHIHEPGGISSSDGRCRPFDATADGTFGGSGAGVVALRRLEDALADGDPIRAVIRGSAVNNDGARKVGFTAPSVEGQTTALTEALAVAGIDAASVELIETHGTGTRLGDLVEFDALRRVYDVPGAPRCTLGTLKASLGHLDAAAGVVGLIGAVLCVERAELPGSPWFTAANPLLAMENTRFQLLREPSDWLVGANGGPRRAAVTSLGIGGTNAHVVLEEAPARASDESARATGRPQVLLVSARDPAGLAAQAERYAGRLETTHEEMLPAFAAATRQGRRHFGWRQAAVGDSVQDLARQLRAAPQRRRPVPAARHGAPQIALLLSGQGAQQAGMGESLYHGWSQYRLFLDECAELLAPHMEPDLRDVIFGPQAHSLLARTEFAQPALFAVEHSLARLWSELGVTPDALVGHSLGEYVAACLAGVFTLPDALRLVATRGRLMQQLPEGAMLAIRATEQQVRNDLPQALDIAAVNAPLQTVVAGPPSKVEQFAASLQDRGIAVERLASKIAFHSRAIDPMLDALGAAVEGVARAVPGRGLLSNETGTWADPDEVITADYWVRHSRAPVQFASCVSALVRSPERILLEVGPGRALVGMARRRLRTSSQLAVASLLSTGESSLHDVLSAAGQLWTAGVPVHWDAIPGAGSRAPMHSAGLPGYAFAGPRSYLPHRPLGAMTTAADGVVEPATRGTVDPATSGTTRDLTAEVQGVWREVFGREDIHADDDFFDLGGTSLLAAQTVTRLRRDLGSSIPMSLIFTATTPAALADALSASLMAGAGHVAASHMPFDLDAMTAEELERLERLLDQDDEADHT